MNHAARILSRTALLAAAGLALAAAPLGSGQGGSTPESPPPRLEQLRWMVGSWSGESDGIRMEEHWIEPRGGVMLGLHRDLFADGGVFFEYLRIEQTPEGIVYFASPRGARTTPFHMLELRGQRVVFHNPEHDFPQRIIYELRDGTTLCARIEGDENGQTKSTEWCWEK